MMIERLVSRYAELMGTTVPMCLAEATDYWEEFGDDGRSETDIRMEWLFDIAFQRAEGTLREFDSAYVVAASSEEFSHARRKLAMKRWLSDVSQCNGFDYETCRYKTQEEEDDEVRMSLARAATEDPNLTRLESLFENSEMTGDEKEEVRRQTRVLLSLAPKIT
jgi:hypothetical protein